MFVIIVTKSSDQFKLGMDDMYCASWTQINIPKTTQKQEEYWTELDGLPQN